MSADSTSATPQRTPKRRMIRDRVVAEIVEVLIDISGAAHQDVVIDRIALKRGEEPSDSLRREIVERFEAHLARSRRRPDALLVRRAFGETSRRWVLEPGAYSLFKRPQAARAWPMVSPARPSPLYA